MHDDPGMITLSWGALGAACAFFMAVFAIGGAFLRYERRITTAENSSTATALANTTLTLELGRVKSEFADYREKAAAKFVNDHELANVEKRFADGIEGLRNDIRGVTDRLDRVLEGK